MRVRWVEDWPIAHELQNYVLVEKSKQMQDNLIYDLIE